MKNIIFLVVTLSTIISTIQSQTVEKLTYQAFITSDYTKWQQAVNYIKNNTDLKQTSNVEKLIHCYYALASAFIAKKQKAEAEKTVDIGESLVDRLLEKDPNNAIALCYKGDFLGYRIALNKAKAVTLGNKSKNYLQKALKLSPNNPQILFDNGNLLYYPPKMFGGDKAQALRYYQKAIAIYERQGDTKDNWVYVQLLVVQGHSYELLGNDKKAEASYLKVLRIAPNLRIVKYNLYPNLINRMNGVANSQVSETNYAL